MTFARVKPGDWAVNEELTSAQLNQLDIDHAGALDKSGDDITGDIAALSGARMLFGSGSFCTILSGGIFEVQSGGLARFIGGGTLTMQSSSTFGCSGVAAFTAATVSINAASTFTVACSLEANGGVNATTGYFSNDLTCYKNFIMDGDSIAGNNKLRIKDAAYLDVESLSRARFLSGGMLETLTGSTVETNGTVTFNSGSTISFAASPTFANGFTASTAGTVSISVPLTCSGATTNLSSTTTTLTGASNKLKLDSRDVVRVLPNALARCSGTNWSHDPALYDNYRVLVVGATADIALDLPHNSVIKYVDMFLKTGSGHAAFPVTMPSWTLYRRTIVTATLTAVATRLLDSAADFASTIGNYTNQLIELVNAAPLAITVDRSQYVYFIRLATEDSTGSQIGTQYLGTKITATVTEYDEG